MKALILAAWLLTGATSYVLAQVNEPVISCELNTDRNMVCHSKTREAKFTNKEHIDADLATKEYVDTAIAAIGDKGSSDIFNVIDEELAQNAFVFGFFAIFSMWIIGFGIGLSRRLIFFLSK